ncbi:TetR/AcrR family transcriptional regulator [Nonomuraea indica]|uniref:TetR/AcrR family transcriptional regulator n=1 Tax=Nonomuraea indica TaxID=1581193 RepID=UPI000C7E5BBA|nr:TetR/AcrR family transcriptional regulator [Nonomuraea indica]
MMKPPNPERRSEKSHRATLEAALDLCAEQGYAQATVEGIAARAGVSKKTIYRWWPSKGAVVLEAVHEASLLPTAFPDTGDLAADLHTQLMGVIDMLQAPRVRSAFIGVLTEAQHDPALAGRLHCQWLRPRIDEFQDRLRRAQELEQVPHDVDLDITMDLLYGPIFHRLMVHLPLPDAVHMRKVIVSALPSLGRPPGGR